MWCAKIRHCLLKFTLFNFLDLLFYSCYWQLSTRPRYFNCVFSRDLFVLGRNQQIDRDGIKNLFDVSILP